MIPECQLYDITASVTNSACLRKHTDLPRRSLERQDPRCSRDASHHQRVAERRLGAGKQSSEHIGQRVTYLFYKSSSENDLSDGALPITEILLHYQN